MTSECDINKTLPDLVLDLDNEDEEANVSTHQEDHLHSDFQAQSDHMCSNNNQSTIPDCQAAGPSQTTSMLNSKQSSDEQKPKTEVRSTPRRAHLSNSRGNSKLKQAGGVQGNIRLCEQHTFLTDVTEVRQMEQGLLKLLDDFHSGKLQAFGKDSTFEKMEQVREQQEKLARLHFELNAQQEIYGPQSEEGRSVGRENLWKIMENLRQLSCSIEQLQISSPSVQTDV